jgi:hypothetical protein
MLRRAFLKPLASQGLLPCALTISQSTAISQPNPAGTKGQIQRVWRPLKQENPRE